MRTSVLVVVINDIDRWEVVPCLMISLELKGRYTKESSFIKSEKSLLVEAMKPFLLRFGIKLSLN